MRLVLRRLARLLVAAAALVVLFAAWRMPDNAYRATATRAAAVQPSQPGKTPDNGEAAVPAPGINRSWDGMSVRRGDLSRTALTDRPAPEARGASAQPASAKPAAAQPVSAQPAAAKPAGVAGAGAPSAPGAAETGTVEPATIRPEERLSRIPVLMYHEIGDVNNGNYVRRSEFEAQMKWLADNEYSTVSLRQVYRHLNDFRPLPPKPVVITFDDGYATFFTVVVPILQKYSMTATNFIATGLIGRPDHMTWEQVAALPDLGMEVGSHTVNHPDLRYLSGERLQSELTASKQVLEKRTNVKIEFFCYPAGKYTSQTPGAVKAAGYLGALTTESGPVTPAQSPFLWTRVRISRGETAASFRAKLRQAAGGGN